MSLAVDDIISRMPPEVKADFDKLPQHDRDQITSMFRVLGYKASYTKEQEESARNKMTVARTRMLYAHPFWGQLAMQLTLRPCTEQESYRIPTAATNGKEVIYNVHFVNDLDINENVFLIAHEIGHCMFDHFIRRGDRDPKLWNVAGDFAINGLLDKEKVGKVITLIDICLDRKKYDGMSSEEIYKILEQEQKENGGSGSGSGDQQTLDQHYDQESDENDTWESADQMADTFRDRVIQAAKSCSTEQVPEMVRGMIHDFTHSRVDWREFLKTTVLASLPYDYTWKRPNKKSYHFGAILPSMDRDKSIKIAIAIDTSGSISQKMLKDFMGEIAGIMEQFTSFTLYVMQFDTRVYGMKEFTENTADELYEYEITGGGGTDFSPVWEHLKEIDYVPDQLLVFTDGGTYDWGDPDYCDTLFIINQDYGKVKAPHGQSVYYEEH